MTAHVAHNSGNVEWYTPEAYITAAREVMGGIDLDPASCAKANEVVRATRFYTVEDDGLSQPWAGRVWMNPPYAQPLVAQFCQRLVDHYRSGAITEAIVLTNNGTETRWFRCLSDASQAMCLPTGRVRFWHPDRGTTAPLQGQAVLYFGVTPRRFTEVFESFGPVSVFGKGNASPLSEFHLDTLSAEDVERLWRRLQSQHAAQNADPELHANVARAVDRALSEGRITAAKAEEIRAELRRSHPRAVLCGYLRDIVPNRPALGAVPRRERVKAPDLAELLRRDPARQVPNLMDEMGRFTRDEDRILQAISDLCERAGIADGLAESAAVEGLRQLRASWAQAEYGRAS